MEIKQIQNGNLLVTVTTEERDCLSGEIECKMQIEWTEHGIKQHDLSAFEYRMIAKWFFLDGLKDTEYKYFDFMFKDEPACLSKDVVFNDVGDVEFVCEHWVLPVDCAEILTCDGEIELHRKWLDCNYRQFTGDIELLRKKSREATCYNEYVKATIDCANMGLITTNFTQADLDNTIKFRGRLADLCVLESCRIREGF